MPATVVVVVPVVAVLIVAVLVMVRVKVAAMVALKVRLATMRWLRCWWVVVLESLVAAVLM